MGRFRFKTAGAVALAVSISLVMAGLTYAASNHAISGTVYSGCSGQGPWYVSTVERVKEGNGDIKAQFSLINTGGLTFKLLDPFNVQIGNTQSWAKNEIGVWRTFADSVPNGTRFYNAFRETSYACPNSWSDYNFSGTEWY